ncbi:MAG: hypothetical protein CM15mV145_030 [uncultured marine virus]|nr:MAG: hypothetical protein CM15mV145_030 [uncultured marine virus]
MYLEGLPKGVSLFIIRVGGTRGKAPFKNIFTGSVVDGEKGMKMSKSMGKSHLPRKTY